MAEPLGILGLARKARAVELGAAFSAAAARSGRACLLIIAQDASENTKARLARQCAGCPAITLGYSGVELGRAIDRYLDA